MAATASDTTTAVEWYVITDEADLTLRIVNGLRVGEDRWGELTLNHPVAAHRWLEFAIEEDGSLTCRACRRDVVIEIDSEPQELLQLTSGDPIQLPHNRVHISDSFRRGPSDAAPAVVRCVEVDESASDGGVPTLAQIVITESDLSPVESHSDTATTRRDPSAFQDALVDKMAERGQTMRMRTATVEESIETALIPVDAESPFAANEVSDALKRPIDVPERTVRTPSYPSSAATPTPAQRGAANNSRITPTQAHTAVGEKRSYTYLWTLSAILGVGILAAIIAAISNAPEQTRSATKRAATVEATPAVPPTRTEALLASVQNIIARSGQDDPAAWDFAVRSYEYILAAEPDNQVVRRRLAAARSRVASLRARGSADSATVATAGATEPIAQAPAPRPSETVTGQNGNRIVLLSEDASVPARTQPDTRIGIGGNTGNAGALAGGSQLPGAQPGAITLPLATVANAEPLTAEQVASRLRLAAVRLADGQIIAPRGSSASALVLSVLATDPTHREAINLLNASADVLVTQAEQAYEAGQPFQARNTLEEVLSFHPKHGRANQRWLEWTGAPSRYR